MDYNAMDMKQFIKKVLETPEMCPCLMIGDYVNIFKHEYKGNICRVYTLSHVRSLIEEYEGIESVNDGVLVMEGIGNLLDVGQNSLLKFIEEAKFPIIILSYNDMISSIILSRMKVVVKRSETVKSLDFTSVRKALEYIDEKKQKSESFDKYMESQYIANHCPMLQILRSMAGDPYDEFTNRRMINIMYPR